MNDRLPSRLLRGRVLRHAETALSRTDQARAGSVLAALWISCILDRLHCEGG